jgi:hypothetical protein
MPRSRIVPCWMVARLARAETTGLRAGGVNDAGWSDDAWDRQGPEGPDLRRAIRTSLTKSKRRARARKELRGRAKGLGPDEVEGLLREIWAAHGLAEPPSYARPALIDRALGRTGPVDDVRTIVDVARGTREWVGRTARSVRRADQADDPLSRFDPATEHLIETTPEASVEVLVDDDAQSRLTELTNGASFSSDTVVLATVALVAGPEGSIEVWERESAGDGGRGRLGQMPPVGADPYREHVYAAQGSGRVAVCRAVRTPARHGGWHLHLLLPRPRADRGET